MGLIRRLLGGIACVWLLSHAAVITLTPVVLWACAEDLEECTCLHDDHVFCPMHKKVPSKYCAMQGVDDGVAVPGSLLMTSAPLPAAEHLLGPPPASLRDVSEVTSISLGSAPPDLPPPRA